MALRKILRPTKEEIRSQGKLHNEAGWEFCTDRRHQKGVKNFLSEKLKEDAP
jgi:hypothetical protein